MALGNGTRLAQYRLEEKIGAGGMGEVWRAVDTTLDRSVALKILPDVLANDAQRLARLFPGPWSLGGDGSATRSGTRNRRPSSVSIHASHVH